MLKQVIKLAHRGQVITLAMMISGIIMSSEIPTDTKGKSIVLVTKQRVEKADGQKAASLHLRGYRFSMRPLYSYIANIIC